MIRRTTSACRWTGRTSRITIGTRGSGLATAWSAKALASGNPRVQNTPAGFVFLLRREPFFEERHEGRIDLVRRLEVRHVSETGDQQHFAATVRDGGSEELHALLKECGRSGQHVLRPAERERRRLDVDPVVYDRIEC